MLSHTGLCYADIPLCVDDLELRGNQDNTSRLPKREANGQFAFAPEMGVSGRKSTARISQLRGTASPARSGERMHFPPSIKASSACSMERDELR